MSTPRRQAVVGLGALLLLLGIVGIASTGSVPVGSGAVRRPSETLVDVSISLVLLVMLFGAGLWAYLLLIRRDVVAEVAAARRRRGPLRPATSLAVAVGLLAVLVALADRAGLHRRIAPLGRPAPATSDGGSRAADAYRPEFATGPVLLIVGVVAVAIGAWYASSRVSRRRLPPVPESLLPLLSDVLDETLDDLRSEPDPRRAVIAAYSRMERALAAYGLAREPAEAPHEYLRRILSDADVSPRAISRLTTLFTQAKFSSHDVGPRMKDEAIEALEAIREELHAAELLAENQRARAVAELRERANP